MPDAKLHDCLCGCGKPAKSRFLPGHDARLKSRLLADWRSGERKLQAAAESELQKLGWLYLVDPTAPRPEKKRALKTFKAQEPQPTKSGKTQEFRSKQGSAARTERKDLERAAAEQQKKRDREKVNILKELTNFGQTLCVHCSHDHDAHVVEDGRMVCIECHDERIRVHQFRSLLAEASGFFNDQVPISVPVLLQDDE